MSNLDRVPTPPVNKPKVVRKAKLVRLTADKTGIHPRVVTVVSDAFFDEIAAALVQGGKVTIGGFGMFEVKRRAARPGRNPQTGVKISIPARMAPVYRASPWLKVAIAELPATCNLKGIEKC